MGNKLIVSFHIEYDNAESYNKIYEALNAAIKSDLRDDQWWAETSSFYVVDTPNTSHQFATRVAKEAAMRSTKDTLVVLNTLGNGGAAWGKIQDPTLFKLLPFVQKL